MTNKKTYTFLLVIIFSVNLFAGGIIKIKSIQEDGGKVFQNIIYVQDGKLRMESTDKSDKTITILDTEKGELTVISPEKGSYIVLTEDDFNNFVQKVNKQKEEMLKRLPEDQREAMKKMIDQQINNIANQPKTKYEKIGNENLKGYDCEVYKGTKGNVEVEKTWITSWHNMKLKDEYVKVFKGMEKFYKKIAEHMGEFGNIMEDDIDVEMFNKGFPVKTIQYEDGKPVLTEIIEEVSEDNLPASLFEAPKDMTRRDPMEE